MRFSLATLITVTSLAAWFLGLSQVPRGYRAEFVASTILLILLVLFAYAMTARRDETGSLDYENSALLDALEPTFKIAFVLAGIAVLAVLGFIIFGIYGLSTI